MKQIVHSLRRCSLLLLVSAGTCISSFGQYTESSSVFEAGISIGPTNLLSDLGGNAGRGTKFVKDNNFPATKLIFGAYLSYQPNEWLGFRLALNRGTLVGDDALIKGKGGLEEARKYRNSDVRSRITEGMLVAEFYPTVFLEDDPSDVVGRIRPYGVAGIGLFHFKPQGTDPLTHEWVDLQPLHTEGQGFAEYPGRKDYKLTAFQYTLGAGAKYFFSEKVNLSLELLHRTTNTDYIDDVSTTYIDGRTFYKYMSNAQALLAERMANKSGNNGATTPYTAGMKRGTSTNNDAYFSINLKLGFRLGRGGSDYSSTRCPVRF
ncbi:MULTISPECIES: outer membrane beta-barrel protein [Niastella]|uniref:Outer membrane beta-barrel protein n=1 Tax=Niastella soli TaxID=2821487 RepID=A0ABS3YTZ2_9BACT|nr:outer membrane beta-barrel protein [Niastella soli]MBO9200890.1 outer membrane beta-barrel protein [Niastella soli]